MNKTFTAEAAITINAAASKVWEALTKPELIKAYLFGTEVTTDWDVGSPITYKGVREGKPFEVKGQVLQIIREKLLVSAFWSSLSGLSNTAAGYKIVRYELAAKGSGTRLTITQGTNDSQEEARHSEQGWKMMFMEIKKLVEG